MFALWAGVGHYQSPLRWRRLGGGDVATPTALPGTEKEINKPGQPKMINSDQTRKEMIPVVKLGERFHWMFIQTENLPPLSKFGKQTLPIQL